MEVGAAVLGEEANQVRRPRPIDGVEDETPVSLRRNEAAARERIEVVGERRARHAHLLPDVVDATPTRTGTHEQTEDREPGRLPEGGEHGDKLLHSTFLILSNYEKQAAARKAFHIQPGRSVPAVIAGSSGDFARTRRRHSSGKECVLTSRHALFVRADVPEAAAGRTVDPGAVDRVLRQAENPYY